MLQVAGFTLASRMITAVLQFGLVLAISRLLGPEGRGICGLYLVVIATVVIISDFAGGSTTAFLVNKVNPLYLLKVHHLWSIVPALAIPIGFWLAGQIGLGACILLIAASWMHGAFTIQQHLWLAFHQFKLFNYFNLLVPFGSAIFFTLAWFAGFRTPEAYLAALLMSWGVFFIANLLILAKRTPAWIQETGVRQYSIIFKAGISNQLGHLAGLANTRLVFYLLPATALGVLSNGFTLVEASLMVPGSIGQILYSTVARQKEGIEARRWLRLSWWINGFLMVIISSVLLLLPQSFWFHLFGSGFSTIHQYLQWLVPGAFFYSFFLLLSYWQSAHGRFITNFKALLVGLMINGFMCAYWSAEGSFDPLHAAKALSLGWLGVVVFALVAFSKRGDSLQALIVPPGKHDFNNFFSIFSRQSR